MASSKPVYKLTSDIDVTKQVTIQWIIVDKRFNVFHY